MEENSEDSGMLTVMADYIFAALSGTTIPPFIRNNLMKAGKRLSSRTLGIPLALIDGWRQKIEFGNKLQAAEFEGKIKETKAITEGRIKLIKEQSQQIADNMNVPVEYAEAAITTFGEKIIGERVNLDCVLFEATEQLQFDLNNQKAMPPVPDDPESESKEKEISDDWLNAFEAEASKMTSDKMRSLFGKILAGEIQKPSSFSIRTIKLLSQLDNEAANLFKNLCSMAISIDTPDSIIDARVLSLGLNADQNSLQRFGLSFPNLNILHEYGLIIPDFNSSLIYDQFSFLPGSLPQGILTYLKKPWAFERVNNLSNSTLKFHGVALSFSGRQLLPIVDVERNEDYENMLGEFLFRQGVKLTDVMIKN